MHNALRLSSLVALLMSGAFFIIREKKHPAYEVVDGEDVLDGADNVLRDQTIVLKKKQNKAKYPGRIRRIVYYTPDLHRTFTYYTNNFYLAAKDIALLYKYRVKSFGGESFNAVRIQIHVAIITYCLIGIIEHDLKLGRPIIQVMRILGSSLLTKDDIRELFTPSEDGEDTLDGQLEIDFEFD